MSASNKVIQHIVVLGGGTAGWLAANHLAKKLHPDRNDGVAITLIESPTIPTIGVGEGTVPMMRNTLRYFGISETQFFRECEASFKQSIEFIGWENNPGHVSRNAYHHIFDYPRIQEPDVTPYWLQHLQAEHRFADVVGVQSRLCDAGLAPKSMAHSEFDGFVNYAYHLNAGKFGQLLAQNATTKLGVVHRFAEIVDAEMREDGCIDALISDDGTKIYADFFVDCSGFHAALLEKKLRSAFVDKSDILFVDHAIVMQVPYKDDNAPIACSTLATAQEAGWIWDIGLTSRRGTGYVYSSRYTDHDQAEEVFRRYLGDIANDLSARRIEMRIGYRDKFWVKNCAAIGLAQGFVEPLEATGLLMFDVSSRMLADLMPSTLGQLETSAKQFNATVQHAWDRVIDFIKLHYCISKRDDTDFWRDNRKSDHIPNSLLANLETWQHRLPSPYDFTNTTSIFNLDNFLYVLYGMHYPTTLQGPMGRYPDQEQVRQKIAQIQQQANALLREAKPHRQLIEKICQHGLQKI